MRLGKDGPKDLSNEVLAVDYLGTLLGALCFPLLLLPALGVLSAAALTALLNGLCAFYLLLFLRSDPRRLSLCGAAAALCLALIGARAALERAAVSWYLQR
jgi:spermidine synthase